MPKIILHHTHVGLLDQCVPGRMLDNVKKVDQDPAAESERVLSISTFEFFKTHPELLDPDLASLINLDFLIKDNYRVMEQGNAYSRKLTSEIKASEAGLSREEREQSEQRKRQLRKSPSRIPASPAGAGRRKTRVSS